MPHSIHDWFIFAICFFIVAVISEEFSGNKKP